MSRYVPAELRRLVFERAAGRCEYCRFPQEEIVRWIPEHKIVIELDHNNKPLVDALKGRGIPDEHLVLAYQRDMIPA